MKLKYVQSELVGFLNTKNSLFYAALSMITVLKADTIPVAL